MERFDARRNENSKHKIEFLIKTITRTDGYLNSANTKSTILLSLSSAFFAAVLLNYDKFLNRLENVNDKLALSVIAIAILCQLLFSIYHSLLGVIPNLNKSSQANIYSFVDINNYFNTVDDYISQIYKENNAETIKSLASLNYNLSSALLDKYRCHSKSIDWLMASIKTLALMAFFIIISQI